MIFPSDFFKIRYDVFYNKKIKKDVSIAIIGDIHLSRLIGKKVLDSLLHVLETEHIDYVCFVGDLIDSPKELENDSQRKGLKDFICSLSKIATVLIVLGNHDYSFKNGDVSYHSDFWEGFNEINNVHLLKNALYQDDSIVFMGYFQQKEYFFNKQLEEDNEQMLKDLKQHSFLYKNLPSDLPHIGLIHSPYFAHNEEILSLFKSYDYLFCGHQHNGCLPIFLDDFYKGNRGIISPKGKLFPSFARGIIDLSSGSKLVVTGGIVKIQDCAPKILQPLNHLCYKHMNIIKLTNQVGDFPTYQKRINTKKVQ